MTFEWLSLGSNLHLDTSLGLPGFLVAAAYLAVTLVIVARDRHRFGALTASQWALLVGLVIAGLICAPLLTFQLNGPGTAGTGSLPLIGLAPVAAAALWLGAGPALIVGLAAGLAMGLFDSGRLTQAFEIAIAGALIAVFLRQNYRGRAARWLRMPVVAVLLGSLCAALPLGLVGLAATDHLPFYSSLDRVITLFGPTLAAYLAFGLVSGLALQALVAAWPGLARRSDEPTVSAPWERHLGQWLAYALTPLAVLAVIGLVGVVAISSYQVATNLVIEQMGRSAANAGIGVPFFIQEGRSLIRNVAEGQANGNPGDQLAQSLRGVPYFQQLIEVDANGGVIASYPPDQNGSSSLFPDEQNRVRLALGGGVPTEVTVYSQAGTFVSFVSATSGQAGSNGALVGRTALANNPALAPVVNVLQGSAQAAGHGVLIDSQNRVLLSPDDPALEGTTFDLGVASPLGSAAGQAYRVVNPDGTRSLVVVLPIAGQSDWSVVLTEPNEVVLRLAAQIAVPTLALLIVIVGAIGAVGVVVARGITRPIESLLSAAQGIGEGDLEKPVTSSGEDEIGQLGSAFEQMRVHLKNRLEEQERLLRVSRSVSSSLELFRAMPPILSSALDVTRAAGVRITLRLTGGGLEGYSAGSAAPAMASLDGQLTDLVERQGTVVISNVQRASGSLNVEALPQDTRALVALPLRSENSFHGALWLTYDREHMIEQSELTFLGTLAGQAAVAIANARLLAEAQEGRQNLEAILHSTADGMIVVDNHGKIALMNPAAEQQFNVRQEHARGRAASDVITFPHLAALLTDFKEPVATMELPGSNGRTLLVNTSTIVGHDGTITGRVALLRDITPIRELDNIKTVFLRMVSHDLRSPLTYMRGYLSLIPLSGELNQAQMDSLGKVNVGIQHISEMTERLLYLSRLKFGDEAELELALIDVDEMLHEIVTQLKSASDDRTITVTIEVGETLPLLLVDGLLYQQAISNLVGNAIKYTQEGGAVTISAYVDGGDHLTVAVSDNGQGIRPEDQARLFEAFYRVPQREGGPARPPGSGLGLALVKAIAETHNGTVGVESTFGEGSTFRLSIPIRNPADY